MASPGAMLHLPDWSDDDDQDNDGSEIAPWGPSNPLSRTALLERVKGYKTILQAIHYQQTTDLAQSLASRAHLERLVDRYWDHCLKEGAVEDAAERGEDPEEEVKDKLREMILHHPSFRQSPLLLRWPLLAADVPKPAWTLSDEITAVLERQRRAILGNKSGDGIRDECVEPIDLDIALPAMVSCQHALVGVLHDLSIKSGSHTANASSAGSKRDSIFTWRDILSTLAMRSDVPATVFHATQNRLEEIYGRVEKAAPSVWMSNMGMGGTDMVLETLKRQDGTPFKYQSVSRPKVDVAKGHLESIRALDKELLLVPATKKARYLEIAPVKGNVKRAKK